MSKKKAFALRVNEDMMKAIEKWAADEFRSTNGQIRMDAIASFKRDKKSPHKKREIIKKRLQKGAFLGIRFKY